MDLILALAASLLLTLALESGFYLAAKWRDPQDLSLVPLPMC
jgi:hypothetical protein